MGTPRRRYHRVIAAYDRLYRALHGLDRPTAQVGPVFRVEVRRSPRTLVLGDGPVVRRGDPVCVLHLNNERIAGLHADGLSPLAVGLDFRRQIFASLQTLAAETQPGRRLAGVRAYTAVTIFHRGLQRIGFEVEPGGLAWPRLTAAYQRALLASLHPSGLLRLASAGAGYGRAERLWISREKLLTSFDGAGRASTG